MKHLLHLVRPDAAPTEGAVMEGDRECRLDDESLEMDELVELLFEVDGIVVW